MKKIAFIGKFGRLYDEEYIARSFEMLGCEVVRISQQMATHDIERILLKEKLDILLYCKWEQPVSLNETIDTLKREGVRTVCWLFDLYFNYQRERYMKNNRFFRSDYVFTTDGGNDHRWKELGINHFCVRQGIYAPECFIEESNPVYDVIFVGSENPYHPERTALMKELGLKYNFSWFGRRDTNEVRGTRLNSIFAETKVVVGDSVYSPNYWSNRVVETLGRGGFLIHKEVPGIKEEYPYLVTYDTDLFEKIDYYLAHEDERKEIVQKNFEFVRDNYTMEKQCQKLLNFIS